MKSSTTLAASFFLCIAGGASAQETVGEAEYMFACAGCHGKTGKGDGPIAGLLEINTPYTPHASGGWRCLPIRGHAAPDRRAKRHSGAREQHAGVGDR